ncbi:hypothetical protein D9756_011176 [Leucocoprinus leucothites]|uniref:Uncharacterized protein n=1 Tax=Leucocoprinus leucothites TaxID=201217 RepID=A0A8H5FPZ5_9AGAR|nr:hypothetical protein D9756_011176 [Leucoagaricus leucothites]
MADQWGLMPEDYAADSSTARTNTYVRSIAITLLAYDTIYLIPDELALCKVRYMYWNGPWSRPRIIHLTIRITTWIHALFDFYTQNNTFLSGSHMDLFQVLSALGPVNTFNLAGFQGVRLDDVCLNISPSFIGTRLIINMRKANCGFGESIVSRQMRSDAMPRFHNSTDHDDDDFPSIEEPGDAHDSTRQ